MRVFHKSLNAAVTGPALRGGKTCPSPCILLAEDRLTPIGQDRLILTRSGAGAPELQWWARCLPVFALPPRWDK